MRVSKNIFVAILMFGFLMNFVFAIVAEAAQKQPPMIRAIIPDKGVADDIITINGERFGDNEKSVYTGYRYVRVGGFINTKIVSWDDSTIKVIAPTLQEATSDITRLNPFWLVADVVSLKLLSFAAKLFDATVSPVPTDIDNIVAIMVVIPPFQESNQGFFTYAAQPSLAKDFNNLLAITYDTYGKDIVGLLSNPKELAKTKGRETMRGFQEVPLFIRDLFTGRDLSRSSTTKKDYCDFSHYIIEYNEPQPTIEAVRDKITSLSIGWYSAMKDGNRTIIEIRGNEKDGPLTKTELDKLNNGLAELGVFKPLLFNSLETTNGVCGRPNEPILIYPKDIEKLWESGLKQESILSQPNTQTPQLPQTKQGKITALVMSPDGQLVYQAKYWLVDSQGQVVDKSAGGIAYDSVRYTTQMGRLETIAVPNGQYTLNITCAANCMFRDKFAQSIVNDIYAKWSKTLQVEMKGSDIWLDKIILIREK